MAELLIFGGIALFSTVVGTGWYTCFYKPISQSEENGPSPSSSAANQQQQQTKLEESSSIESILNSDKKITDREYIGKLERGRLTKMIITPGESIFEEDENNHDGDDESATIMNGMEGYEELPEHSISLVLNNNNNEKKRFIPSTSLLKNSSQKLSTSTTGSFSVGNHDENEDDGGIDFDKFLKKDQEIKELEFEKNLQERYPFNFK